MNGQHQGHEWESRSILHLEESPGLVRHIQNLKGVEGKANVGQHHPPPVDLLRAVRREEAHVKPEQLPRRDIVNRAFAYASPGSLPRSSRPRTDPPQERWRLTIT